MLKRTMIAALTLLACTSLVSSGHDDGQPFGRMKEKDLNALAQTASQHGVDIKADLKKAYSGDQAALARVFGLAVVFQQMDSVTRAYGNLLYSSFLNLMEGRGEDYFAGALLSLSEPVQQRVRDFLYYPMRNVPKRHRAEVDREIRRDYPRVFPADYEFGKSGGPFG